MSSVEVQDRKALHRSLAAAQYHLERAVRERAPEGAIAALQGQIVELLDLLDWLDTAERLRKQSHSQRRLSP